MDNVTIGRLRRQVARRAVVPGVLAMIMALGALVGCQSNRAPADTGKTQAHAAPHEQAQASGTLTVFAAKSLAQVFQRIADEVLAQTHPDLRVTFSFDGSNTLVRQIIEGAPADVIATADEDTMADLSAAEAITPPDIFATNTLRLAVPAGNPGGITGLDDSLVGKKLVICAPRVPCGRATAELAAGMGIELHAVSEENNVGQVRAKIETGAADAGLIYLTDALAAAPNAEIIEVPGIEQVRNRYPIAIVTETHQRAGAEAFIEAVQSARGQEILSDAGFTPPSQ